MGEATFSSATAVLSSLSSDRPSRLAGMDSCAAASPPACQRAVLAALAKQAAAYGLLSYAFVRCPCVITNRARRTLGTRRRVRVRLRAVVRLLRPAPPAASGLSLPPGEPPPPGLGCWPPPCCALANAAATISFSFSNKFGGGLCPRCIPPCPCPPIPGALAIVPLASQSYLPAIKVAACERERQQL